MAFGRENPCKIRLLERVRLSGAESAKDIYRLVFEANELDYLPGDSLAVFAKNDPHDVQSILRILHLTGDEPVNIKDESITIQHALSEKFCITHLTKRFLSSFVERLVPAEREEFEKIFTDENIEQCSLLELLTHFPSVRFTPEELCRLLKKSAPRFYSIASAPTRQGEKIYLIVNTVSYKNFWGNVRYGVVSHFLNHRLTVGEYVDAYIMSSSFKLPTDRRTDVIMVGPGTGLAPFMSFLYDLEAASTSGSTVGRAWLFFGDQHKSTDFIERDELGRLLKNHILTRLDLAFSRDQEGKIYVQDRMWDAREELWDWLAHGASFYVCGNAARMAVDVEQVLKNIAIECGKMSLDEADQWLTDLCAIGRYQRDVY